MWKHLHILVSHQPLRLITLFIRSSHKPCLAPKARRNYPKSLCVVLLSSPKSDSGNSGEIIPWKKDHANQIAKVITRNMKTGPISSMESVSPNRIYQQGYRKVKRCRFMLWNPQNHTTPLYFSQAFSRNHQIYTSKKGFIQVSNAD